MVYLTYGADLILHKKSLKYKETRIRCAVIMICHVIEKGFTMPNSRLGFGEDRINELCHLLKRYSCLGYDISSFEVRYALKILNEYLIFHERDDYSLNKNIIELIKSTLKEYSVFERVEQLNFTRDLFFKNTNSSFLEFSRSRYSVRNYSEYTPPLNDFVEAIKLAQNAPTSCNRQPVRVYVVINSDLIMKILEVQRGSRGFGQLTKTLLVVTTNNSYFGNIIERNQPSLNAGFFGMSLLYALHYKQIGSATLNWSQDKRNDKKLHQILNIEENEQIHFLVSCGYVPKEFKVAASLRRDVEDIIEII